MTKLAPFFLVLAIAFGTFGFYQHHEASTLWARVAELEAAAAQAETAATAGAREVETLRGQVESQKAAIGQLESRNKELASGASAATGSAAGGGGGEAKGGNGFMSGLAKMFNDPKTRDAMRAQQAAQVNVMYAGLAQELGLERDVARQVLALLGDRQADIAAKGMSAYERDGKDLAAMGKETEAVKKAYDDQIKALLGEDGHKKFDAYEQSMGDRIALDQIQRQLSAAGTALEPPQQKSLLEIMTEERKRSSVPSATTANPAEANKLMRDDAAVDQWLVSQQAMNRRVLDRTRTLLSADQFAAFETAQKSFLDMQKMGVQMSREMFRKK